MIVAMGIDRIEGFQIFDRAIKAEDYGNFLINIVHNNDQIQQNIDNYVFYVDNCSTHHAVIVKDKLYDKFHFFYGPPYTPEFNCVENLFSVYK